jgi:cadmium resistance protein CadD (predicted permease)
MWGLAMIKLTIFLISLICLCFSGTRLIGIAVIVLMCYAYPWMLIVVMALALGGLFLRWKLMG